MTKSLVGKPLPSISPIIIFPNYHHQIEPSSWDGSSSKDGEDGEGGDDMKVDREKSPRPLYDNQRDSTNEEEDNPISSSEEAPENSNDRLDAPPPPLNAKEEHGGGNMRKKLRRFVHHQPNYSPRAPHSKLELPDNSSSHLSGGAGAGSSRASTPSLTDIPLSREDPTTSSSYSLSRKHEAKRSHTPDLPLNADLNGGLVAHERLLSGLPYLQLLPPAIRNDAAARLFFMPTGMLPSEIPSASASQSSPASHKQAKSVSLPPESSRGPRFLCEPCNIKFSSAKTLEAHQTYYCSFRKDVKDSEKTDISADGVKIEISSGRETPGSSPQGQLKKRERMSSGEDRSELLDDSALDQSLSQPGNKLQKTGKLYACIYCSYSADKKVSLNRHMRMHSGPAQTPSGSATPTPTPHHHLSSNISEDSLSREEGAKSSDGMSAFERYCQDCDIQFSNIKTFRVHKQYYCSTRHVLKAQQIAAAAAGSVNSSSITIPSESPPTKHHQLESPNSDSPRSSLQTRSNKLGGSPASALDPTSTAPPSTNSMGSQPFVVLPTNPVIIVPYSFLQGASVLPSNVLPSQNALVVLPNGSVQCLPASTPSASIIPVSISSPSPVSIASLMLSSLSHPPNPNQSTPSNTTGLSAVFNDPKDVIKNMPTSHSINTVSRHSSDDSLSEHESRQVKTEFQTTDSLDNDSMDMKHNPKPVSTPHQQGQDGESQPAIDLTVRPPLSKKSLHHDDEKENRALGYSMSPTSGTTPQQQTVSRSNSSPSEHFSLDSDQGSDKKLQRPSSASMSSACSTPPSQFEPKINGILSQVSPGILAQELNPNLSYARKTPSLNATSKGQDFNPSEHHTLIRSSGVKSGGGGGGGVLTTTTTVSEKISSISAKLPGGAILTRANTQSLADLLLANSQDSSEITSLRTSSHPLLGSRSSPGPINPALLSAINPELALRFLDPAYLATLQHSLHQQQLQTQQKLIQQQFAAQSQTSTHGVKRGVSKCVECDIVFYKYENFLVHKEHYCAATRNPVAAPQTLPTPPPSLQTKKSHHEHEKRELTSPTCSSPKSDDADEKPASPASPMSSTPRLPNTLKTNSLAQPLKSSDDNYEDVKPPRSTSTGPPPPLRVAPSPTGSSSSTKEDSDRRTRHSSQHTCKSCGIKYSSLDTLQTHRNFYCRARLETPELEPFTPPPEMINKALEIPATSFTERDSAGLKCSKCRLVVPEDQMSTHLQVCTGLKHGSLPNISTPSSLAQGWKCPCCNVYSPTMSAAQKHLETHSGIRAFKCLLCGYRGNTLRGMRTHIRMHFDKRVSDLQEGDYISCITAANEADHPQPDTSESPTLGNFQVNNMPLPKSESHSKAASGDEDASSPKLQTSEVEVRNGQKTAQQAPLPTKFIPGDNNDSCNPVDGLSLASPACNRLHLCTFCNYTSTYKGNVVRHMKLVHKISEESANDILSSETLDSPPHPSSINESTAGDPDSIPENPQSSLLTSSPSPPTSVNQSDSSQTFPNGHPLLPFKTQSVKFQQSASLTNGRKSGEVTKSPQNPTQQPNSCPVSSREKTCTSSRSSEEEDDTSSAEHANNENSCATQYCKSCNIYFHYPSSFVAHKQFYCSTQLPTPDAETVDRAGTPVQ